MVEIILLWIYCKKMGRIARHNSRKAVNFQLMLVGMALGFELVGATLGVATTGGAEAPAYLFGMVGFVIGIVSAFKVARTSMLEHAQYSQYSQPPTGGFPVIQNPPAGSEVEKIES